MKLRTRANRRLSQPHRGAVNMAVIGTIAQPDLPMEEVLAPIAGPIAVVTNSNGPGSYRFLYQLDAASSGTLRFRYAAVDNSTFEITAASFGKWDGVAGKADMTTAPVPITFRAGADDVPAGTNADEIFPDVGSSGIWNSDNMEHPGFTLDAGDWIVVDSQMPDHYLYVSSGTAWRSLVFNGVYTADQQAPGNVGATMYDGLACGLFEIDTVTLAFTDSIAPMSFDDPIFIGVTELTTTIHLNSGDDLTRFSIEETSGDPSIYCDGNNIIDHCRVRSAEALRVTYNNVTIISSYLEATGNPGDHADVIQTFSSPASSGGTITVENSHLVAHNNDATAGIFISDDWSGTLVVKNSIINGGPYGVSVSSDSVVAPVTVNFENVYFVGPFGFGAMNFQGNGLTVAKWTNVKEATIVDGKLVPGNSIPAPS